MTQEVQVGKGHAFARASDDFDHTQSGIYECDILCARCDNVLGVAENIAASAFRKIRNEAEASAIGEELLLKGVSGDDISRFSAGVLWKYSVASQRNGRIDLGPYQNDMQELAFSQRKIPYSFDALLIRLKCHDDVDDVFAYRAPKPGRQEGASGYRLLVGGMFIFAKTDKQFPKGGALERASIRERPHLPYVVMRAQDFEEYQSAATLAHAGKLSAHLDKR